MRRGIAFRPEAADDVEATLRWYEEQKTGLGEQFAEQLSSVLDRVAENPLLHPVAWEDVRLARLRRFPYVVYYRIHADDVEVLAILHGSRDPAQWRSRT